MSKQPSSEPPWSVPVAVADVPETGRHFDVAANARTRDAIAKVASVRAVLRLEAEFELTRHGRAGVRVVGNVSATVEQRCVRTLESMESQIDEAVDLVFAPSREPTADERFDAPDPPEILRNGVVDLGALAIEFLLLGIDPYPRKPGAVFEAPQSKDDPGNRPFAALAALKKGMGDPES